MDKVFDESVLDFPSQDLDLDVWMKSDGEDSYTLRPECREKVLAIVDAIVRRFKIPQCSVNITGSITSNSYTQDSDVDLHFNSPKVKEDKVEDLTKAIRVEFENYKAQHAESDWHLGQHPIEVYFQGNVFQDMMSVGCYSVLDDTWVVGPELTKPDFNPYSEYYDEDMRYVNNLIGSVRDTILKVYEKALVFGKLERSEQQKSDLMRLLEDAAKLFTEIRETRSAFSAPKSREEALKKRKDRKWKIADSAFKLLDKFGYLAILREYTKCYEEKVNSNEASERIIKVVRDNLGPENKKLHEIDEVEKSKRFKIWIDDVRQAPDGYIWLRSVNDFTSFVEENGVEAIEVVDLDHDSGEYNMDGGDYIRCLDYLEFIGAKDINVRIHTDNPVGRQNMERVIKKNGWNEQHDILGEEERIANNDVYLSNMAKSIDDKAWFLKHLPKDIDTIVDFGGGTGDLAEYCKQRLGNHQMRFIIVDMNKDFLKTAQERGFLGFESLQALMNSRDACTPSKTCLVLSSVIHEVYSYRDAFFDDVGNFWADIKRCNFKMIAIRDMSVGSQAYATAPIDAILWIYQNVFKSDKIFVKNVPLKEITDSFEEVWGAICDVELHKVDIHRLIHFLIKYRYQENWNREVNEDYLPVSQDKLQYWIEDFCGYNLIHKESSKLDFYKKIWSKEFKLNIPDNNGYKKQFYNWLSSLNTHIKWLGEKSVNESKSTNESFEWFSPRGNFDLSKGKKINCKFPPLDAKTAKRLTGLDMVEFIGDQNGATDKDGKPMSIRSCVGTNGGGRAYAIVVKNGIYIPFYVSSGDGDKKSIPTGHWYPFFGKGPDGWLNKGSEKDILNYYGSDQLKTIAQTLDKKLNMNTLVKFDKEHGTYLKGFPYCMASSNNLKDIYNRDVNPTTLGNKSYKKNIDDFLMMIGDFPLYEAKQQIDEGAKEVIASLALSLACAIPGQVDAATTKAAKKIIPMSTSELQKKTQEFESKIHALDLSAKYGEYNIFQAMNILALTLFGEGRGEISNGGIYLIVDSLINRTYNGLQDLPGVCVGRAEGKAFQYSFWNKHKKALQKIKDGEVIVPEEIGNPLEYKAWNRCIELSVDILSGKYKASNTRINSYYVTKMKDPPKWTKLLKDVVVRGNHTFGYYWYNNPKNTDMMTMLPRSNRKNIATSKTYIVKSGDNLWKIAKANGTTAREIALKNNIKLDGILRPGQKLEV